MVKPMRGKIPPAFGWLSVRKSFCCSSKSSHRVPHVTREMGKLPCISTKCLISKYLDFATVSWYFISFSLLETETKMCLGVKDV